MSLLSMLSLISLSLMASMVGAVQYEAKPLKLGAEVVGINLRDHINDTALFDKIREDTYKYRLMVFRDQGEIPADEFTKMFQGFGEIYHQPYTTQTKNMENHQKAPAPAIMRISNDVTEGFKGVGTSGWHIDGAYKEIPFSHLIFNSVKAPIVGATKFAGHREMLASLTKEQFDYLDHLWAVNTRTVLGEKVAVIQPLVYNHPVVNDTVLCVHLGYLLGAIYNYGDKSSQRVLSNGEVLKLKADISQAFSRDNDRLVYSHQWRDGDLVIIDNLQLAHLASKESQLPKEKVGLRILHRLAINGSQKPMKRQHSL